MSGHDKCNETVPPSVREAVLERDNHRCQVCGRAGPGSGGVARLHVHHIERDRDDGDEHALENLTTLCRACHSWQHQQTTGDEVPVDITEDDQHVLLPQDYEILQCLADEGPLSTGGVADALSVDLSVMAVRERLWVLMGLDNVVESRDRQVVDQDVDTGEWGLTGQIAASARGRIPDDPQTLLQRIEDEQVRQALERGCDRCTVADILNVSRRTTFYKEKRAYAYDFPLAAIDSGGGRPTETDDTDVADDQTRLDNIDREMHGSDGSTEEADQTDSDQVVAEAGEGEESDVEVNINQAIDALEAIRAAL